jgi:GT2 family glycosyltransferase
MIDITVVIPTYNRRTLLREAVDSLRRQTHPADRYEIIIVSDGATDGTDDDYAVSLRAPETRLVRQEKRDFGLARARNLGTRLARGPLVLFFDDDMVAHEQLVEKHVAAHFRLGDDVAVRGRVKPSAQLPDTPFCRIVLGDVCRIYEAEVESARFIDFDTALSWQTSFKRERLIQLGGYDETFRCYGWEDIEFSYRVTQHGLRFFYEPQAVSFHNDQRQTLAAHGARLHQAAAMAPVLFARHPQLAARIPMYRDKGPIQWGTDAPGLIVRKVVRQVLATRPVMTALAGLTPVVERVVPRTDVLRRWYYGLLGSYVLGGYREGLRAHNHHGSA